MPPAQEYYCYLLALHIILSSVAFFVSPNRAAVWHPLGGFQGLEHLTQKRGEQNRFS